MRFLHTGDWHLDKTLLGRSRLDEYERALAAVIDVALQEEIDALLVAGDIFDTVTPSAEAERLFYQEFLAPLRGHGIRAVLVAGNHDHPLRLNAVRQLLAALDVQVVALPTPAEAGGVVRLPSRNGTETASIACLPWVHPRDVLSQLAWLGTEGLPYQTYSEQVATIIDRLAQGFSADTVNVLVGHLMLDGAVIGPGGGERPLHLGQTYAVPAQRLPSTAQYVALGHVHRPQEVLAPCPTRYAGSLLELDFGEREQNKSVVLLEAEPRLPPSIQTIPITVGRRLRDLAVEMAEIATLAAYQMEDAFFRVTVRCDGPVQSLAERVREVLPTALQVRAEFERAAPEREELDGSLSPEALLEAYHKERYGRPPRPELLTLFTELLREASH